ncbi:MAG: STAS/SEC14 domain-containing protein [Myxococcaceae bacterium]|nr:MAG: STAS/SEC14 domain-containing protein [Myxococcaceae bacterium]
MDQSREWTCGAHRIRMLAPDALHTQYVGLVGLQDAKWCLRVYEEMAVNGPFYLVAQVQGSELPTESRKYLANNVRAEWMRSVVYVGSDLTQRVVGKAMSVAMLLTGHAASFDTVFVDTMTQAQAWVDAHRLEHAPRRVG